jgi:hypothetical protein
MALETLEGVTEIGGFPVFSINKDQDASKYKNQSIVIDHYINSIHFILQNGPIKEVGVNGCQVDALIEAAKLIIEGLNEKFQCSQNAWAVKHLEHALYFLNKRKEYREKRQVEGKSQP